MVKVIDASVAIKWFIDEPGRDAALKVLSQVIADATDFCVPELFYFELVNVFNRLVPSPAVEQIELLNLIFLFGIHRFAMSPELYAELAEFQRLGLSGYDAAYVAVAKQTKGVWLTFDEKAHKRIARLGLSKVL